MHFICAHLRHLRFFGLMNLQKFASFAADIRIRVEH